MKRDIGPSEHDVIVETRFDGRYMQPLEELSADDLIRLGLQLYRRALKVRGRQVSQQKNLPTTGSGGARDCAR